MGYHKVDDRIHAIPAKMLSVTLKDFYSRMVFRCNHKNKSWWSNDKLADQFQVSVRTIQRWCRRLESLGMIETRRTGRSNEMSIVELTDEDYRKLGVPEEVLGKVRNDTNVTSETTAVSPQRRHQCHPDIKGKEKTKKKTGGRATIDEMWGDPDVQASGKRAVEAAENRKGHTVLSPDNPAAPTKQEEALPDEARLSRWKSTEWTKRFVATMKAKGYEVAFAEYKAADNHITAIRNHLLNLGFSHRKIYRFLLMWLPDVYPSICEAELKKDPDDFMFSVAWMEPRLSRLVTLYNEGTSKPKRSSTKRTAH